MIWLLLAWNTVLTVAVVYVLWFQKTAMDRMDMAASTINRGIDVMKAAVEGEIPPEDGKHKAPVSTVETAEFVEPRIQAVIDTAEEGSDEPVYPYVYRGDSLVLHRVECRVAPRNYGHVKNPWAFTQRELVRWAADEGKPFRECGVCRPLTGEESVA